LDLCNGQIPAHVHELLGAYSDAAQMMGRRTAELHLALSADETDPQSDKIDLTEVSLDRLLNFRVQSVFGASKRDQSVADAPSSVSIIDADEIKKLGRRNFAEILEGVRGLYVTYDRNYSYLGIRGFNRPGDYTSRVLILVDGHRVNENIFDSVLIGSDFPLDIDLIDRVEVIRGPSSSTPSRRFISTAPFSRLRGLTVRRTGRPRRSASLNLTPAETSPRSS
jgi:outer membrane receptor protein involved in Fe transport